MSGKHVIVTGGAGYIGSHVVLRLKEKGFIPIILDNMTNGHDWAVRDVVSFKADISDEKTLSDICRIYEPLSIIHMAAFIDVGESVRDPEKYWDNNYYKTQILFRNAIKCGIKHIVFSSTAAVYGCNSGTDMISEKQFINPLNPYGESKKAVEDFLENECSNDVNYMVFRYFNAAGASPENSIGEAHWPVSNLIPRVILSAMECEKAISVFGTDYPTQDGTAIRDYIHVLDLAEAHTLAIEHLINGGKSDICNLGTGKGHSVMEVIKAVEKYMELKVNVVLTDRREGDPVFSVADASKAKKVLGWEAKYSFDDIVKSDVEWHKGDIYKKEVVEKHYA